MNNKENNHHLQWDGVDSSDIIKSYLTMDRDDLTILEWVQHAQEEAMDLAIYLEKIKQEINKNRL